MSDSKGTDLLVTNLRVEEVLDEDQIETIIKKARKNRAWAKTLANERSSRSHSVFMLKIEGHNTATSETCCGSLNLVRSNFIICFVNHQFVESSLLFTFSCPLLGRIFTFKPPHEDAWACE